MKFARDGTVTILSEALIDTVGSLIVHPSFERASGQTR
jgi:hypothetical protein